MKRFRATFLFGGLFLLMIATTVGISYSGDSSGCVDATAALQAQVKVLEAQLDSSNREISELKAQNDALRGILAAKISAQPNFQPQVQPKGSVPYDYNGMRFYLMPAMPDPNMAEQQKR